MFCKKNGTKFCSRLIKNLYESIPRRIAAVRKAKGVPTPYYKESAQYL
jgi:hypothetical protein